MFRRFLRFRRKKNIVNVLLRENAALKRRLQDLATNQAKIRDMAARIAAGVPTGTPASSGEGVLERLRVLTVTQENLRLRAQIARAEEEAVNENLRLEGEVARIEQQLQESLGLVLITPTSGQTVRSGATLDIRWSSTGPVGDRLRIGLLKNGVFLRNISPGASTEIGIFSWQVPASLPIGDDYQVSIQDPASGTFGLNEIKIR